MYGILANAFKTASRINVRWDAPPHWQDHDHRTRAEKERDAAQMRQMLRQTGTM